MAGHPSARDLVAAVREFIAGLALEGRDAFHAKVAANALAIVERELEQGPDAAEVAALAGFADLAGSAQQVASATRAGSLPMVGSAVQTALDISPPTNSSSPRRPIIPTLGVMGPRLRGDDGESLGDYRTVATATDLRSAICTALRNGTLTPATPGLLDTLTAANLARLAVDNPRYSTFLRRTAAAAPQR